MRHGFKWQGRIGFRQSCLAKEIRGRKSAKPIFFPDFFDGGGSEAATAVEKL
ncbi:MAG: hypothetical protein R2825_09325 [Saprospiraceae bacterium]